MLSFLSRRSRRPSLRVPRPTCRPSLERLEDRYAPAVFNVTNLNDTGDGSLRKAITNANNSTDAASTINFQSGLQGTITLNTELDHLAKNITINGPVATSVIVQRNTAKPAFTIFTISFGANCGINYLTIEDGSATSGGGISNVGTLTIQNDDIAYNTGGGIYNNGTLNVSSCSIDWNSTTGDGGGIDNTAACSIENSEIYNNSAQKGGGIADDSAASSTSIGNNTCIGHNSATAEGGGIYHYDGNLEMDGGTLFYNTAGTNGGGIAIDGTGNNGVTLTGITIQGNAANATSGKGGGAYLLSGTLTLNSCTVTGNTAQTGTGVAYKKPPASTFNNNNNDITDTIVTF
jgi:hypothetical protein